MRQKKPTVKYCNHMILGKFYKNITQENHNSQRVRENRKKVVNCKIVHLSATYCSHKIERKAAGDMSICIKVLLLLTTRFMALEAFFCI